MLDLYHNINAVCAQKVRIALAEKGLTVQEHLMTLRGDQTEVGYLKLNPLGVVPTLLHDGEPIIADSVLSRGSVPGAVPDACGAHGAISGTPFQQVDR
jgi:hypothetical protein